MKIVRIITDINSLLSVQQDEIENNEFDILFNQWNDVIKRSQEQLNRLSRTRDYLKTQGFSDDDIDNLETI